MFDQRLTTQAHLAELDARGITFIALRMRSKSLMDHIATLEQDPKVWKTVRLDRPGRYTSTPKVVDEPAVTLTSYPGTLRQSSAVALNVVLDVVLTVAADAACAALARRMPGYHDATPDLLQRRFLDTEGVIYNHPDRIVVRLNRRAYSPVLRAADLPPTPIPWWGGRTLYFEYV